MTEGWRAEQEPYFGLKGPSAPLGQNFNDGWMDMAMEQVRHRLHA